MSTEAFGLTLLLNKPYEWTSFDVVNKLRYTARRITGRKKIKVGHAGTLDPLATGLVIVCIGSHTKTISEITDQSKQYTGTLVLGATTPSFDLETAVNAQFELPPHDENLLQETANTFLGEHLQVPPIFSAKKIDGKKAYDLARKGKDVKMNPALIKIDSFKINASRFPRVEFILDCSKGTYVRSLANDFGRALNSGAYLEELCRTRIGAFDLSQSLSIDEAILNIERAFAEFSSKSNVS